MDTEVTKQLSAIITLKEATERQIEEASHNFKHNVMSSSQKIDVFQDLQSFLDIALENQDVYDKRKIDLIKLKMNESLNFAAQELDFSVVKFNPLQKKKLRVAENINIPEDKKKLFMDVLKKLGKRSQEVNDQAVKVFQKWRLQRLAKKVMMNSNSDRIKVINVSPQYSSNSTLFPDNLSSIDRFEQFKLEYDTLKRDFDEKKNKIGKIKKLENEVDFLKIGINKIAQSLDISPTSSIDEESKDYFSKIMNMINFEVEYLKKSEDESSYKKALNEIDHLRNELDSANRIIEELSEVNFQNEIELQVSQRELNKRQNKLVTRIETGILDLDKSQLMNKIDELEEEHHHSVIETGRHMNEIKDLQERVKKYEGQLVYYKNNNELQNKEIGHLKNTKRLYEKCMEDLNSAEKEISKMRNEILELNEFKRKYTKFERKFKRMKKSEEWQKSQKVLDETVDICNELEKALKKVETLERQLENEREKNEAGRDERELEILYENSQKEIEHLNVELQNTWKRLNELDQSELLNKLKKKEQAKERLEKKLKNEIEKNESLLQKIKDLETKNNKFMDEARKPAFNSQDMIDIINKIEDTKQGQKFQNVNQESPTSAEYLNEIQKLKSRLLKSEKEKKNLEIDIKTKKFKENELLKSKEEIENLKLRIKGFKKSGEASIERKRHETLLRKMENKYEKSLKKITGLEKEVKSLRQAEKDLSDELERIIRERELFIQATKNRSPSKLKSPVLASVEDQKNKIIAIHSDKNEVDELTKPIGNIQLQELDLNLEQENKALRDELDFMTRLKDKFSKKLNEKRKEVIYMREERDQAIKFKEELEDELERTYENVDRLEDEKIENIRIIEDLRSKLRNTQDYEIEIKNLQVRFEVVNSENDELREKIDIYLKEIQSFKKKIEELGNLNSDIIDGNNLELNQVIEELKILRVKFTEVEVSLTEEIRFHKETKIELQQTVKRCEDLSEKLFHSMNEIELLKHQLDKNGEGTNDYEQKIISYNELQKKLRKDLKEKIEEIMKRDELLGKRDDDISIYLQTIKELQEELNQSRLNIELLEGKLKKLRQEKDKLIREKVTNNKDDNRSLNASVSIERRDVSHRFRSYKVMNLPIKRVFHEPYIYRTGYQSNDQGNVSYQSNGSVNQMGIMGNSMIGQSQVSPVRRKVTPLNLNNSRIGYSFNGERGKRIIHSNQFIGQTSTSFVQNRKIQSGEKQSSRRGSIGSKADIKKIRDLKTATIAELNNSKIKEDDQTNEFDLRRSSSLPFNSLKLSEIKANRLESSGNGFLGSNQNLGFRNSNFAHTNEIKVTTQSKVILRESGNSVYSMSRKRSIGRHIIPTRTVKNGKIKVIKGYDGKLNVRSSRSSLASQSIQRKSYSASKANGNILNQSMQPLFLNQNRESLPITRGISSKKVESLKPTTTHIRNKTFTSFFNGNKNPRHSKLKITSSKTRNTESDFVRVIETEGVSQVKSSKPRRHGKAKKKKSKSPGCNKLSRGRIFEKSTAKALKDLKRDTMQEKYINFRKASKKQLSGSKKPQGSTLSKKLYNFNSKLKKLGNPNKNRKKGITGKYAFVKDKEWEDILQLSSSKKKTNMAKKISMLTGNRKGSN